jgi:hypothetical protein
MSKKASNFKNTTLSKSSAVVCVEYVFKWSALVTMENPY